MDSTSSAEGREEEGRIWVASRSVSDQERAKMEERLDGWAEKLLVRVILSTLLQS